MCGVCRCGRYDEDGNPVSPETDTVYGIRPHLYTEDDRSLVERVANDWTPFPSQEEKDAAIRSQIQQYLQEE